MIQRRLQINAAASMFFKTGEIDPLSLKMKEFEKELRQFAVEFKKFPIPERFIDKALVDLSAAIKQSLDEKGLVDYSKA